MQSKGEADMFRNKCEDTNKVGKMFPNMKKFHNKEKILTHEYRA